MFSQLLLSLLAAGSTGRRQGWLPFRPPPKNQTGLAAPPRTKKMSAYEDEDDCCVCCDTLCEKICGDEDEDDDCACCNKCCTCLPGCGKEDTPDKFCVAGGWCVRRDCCGIWCAGISLGVILLTDLTVVTCVITPWFQGSFWCAAATAAPPPTPLPGCPAGRGARPSPIGAGALTRLSVRWRAGGRSTSGSSRSSCAWPSPAT